MSSSSSSHVIPPPYKISGDDKRGLVVVTTATVLSFVWTCLVIRVWLRWKLREWRSDDYFLAAATVFNTIQSGLVFRVADAGLGLTKDEVDADHLRRISKLDLASQILYVITLFLSKGAVLFLYLRLSPGKSHSIASWATLGVCGAWCIIGVVLVVVPCNAEVLWQKGFDSCSSMFPRWQAITAIDVLTELAIFIIPLPLLIPLKMNLTSKLLVLLAFSARIPVLAASLTRLHYIGALLSSPDPTLQAAYSVVCTQWQVGYAIMSTTISGLGPFLRPFSRKLGVGSSPYGGSSGYRRNGGTGGYASGGGSGVRSHNGGHEGSTGGGGGGVGDSYQMNKLRARRKVSSGYMGGGNEEGEVVTGKDGGVRAFVTERAVGGTGTARSKLNLRPDCEEVERNTNVIGGEGSSERDDADTLSLASESSRKMIITKRTEVMVETDRASAVVRD
ncbi:hypothetical protein BU24DRAFT_408611 [Aaosphaeria arxii CBS 175.79]|uniref:Rhodopsin domain-containing protein n=1 Tax=Aaosphaeria arxii CBS 175.79 TaxID=1450172 RepID=A0A6A5XR59_9PLEO|nr:uncharacterized protein BU24DRAFT_408611 [Aaosphaeria arxii CBS 175.79]KAF2015389.1 hypothetical protein BU24DRAFT_408611 [Aaosphaeria arxii CBS 175.79]